LPPAQPTRPPRQQYGVGKTDVLSSTNGLSTVAMICSKDVTTYPHRPEPVLAAHAQFPPASGSHSLAKEDSAPHCGTDLFLGNSKSMERLGAAVTEMGKV
jgi:hypothetical protein